MEVAVHYIGYFDNFECIHTCLNEKCFWYKTRKQHISPFLDLETGTFDKRLGDFYFPELRLHLFTNYMGVLCDDMIRPEKNKHEELHEIKNEEKIK
jgi:hypothetical protein